MTEEENILKGVTHYTHVEVQPGGINIEHVEHLYQADVLKALGIELPSKPHDTATTCKAQAAANAPAEAMPTELFHFIHPSVTEEEQKLQIHREVANLVHKHSAQDICAYLNTMAAHDRVLLPLSLQSLLPELHRMGMPDTNTEGFAYKTLSKYYRK